MEPVGQPFHPGAGIQPTRCGVQLEPFTSAQHEAPGGERREPVQQPELLLSIAAQAFTDRQRRIAAPDANME